jgi:hypothetical protein
VFDLRIGYAIVCSVRFDHRQDAFRPRKLLRGQCFARVDLAADALVELEVGANVGLAEAKWDKSKNGTTPKKETKKGTYLRYIVRYGAR